MGPWLAVGMITLASCAFDPAPTSSCQADVECVDGACRDGVCIAFATPLDDPVDPGDPPDAGDAAP